MILQERVKAGSSLPADAECDPGLLAPFFVPVRRSLPLSASRLWIYVPCGQAFRIGTIPSGNTHLILLSPLREFLLRADVLGTKEG